MESEKDKKLVNFSISSERYESQFTALCSAGFTEQQANRLILRSSSNNTVLAVLDNQESLFAVPYSLTRKQIVRIAGNIGGSKNIEAVKAAFSELTALHFTPEQIVKIAGHDGGSKNIEAAIHFFTKFKIDPVEKDKLVKILSTNSGHKKILDYFNSYRS